MGEVYRARDTKLGRDVALKILPDHLIDADRLARFTREAQVVASLSHPNIAAIHGLEHLDGRPVLVLELVEGPTLADRIAQGPIPQDEAVSVGRQIAEALEAAHEHGVVHRDLKPANVKLRPDGLVKVLDFGLAKLTDTGVTTTASSATLSPTMTSPAMTGLGLILGTAAYMSPEQAAGKPVDKRADIWSFGVVLWEMLTGQRLFGGGESTSHVLADVLRAPIDFEKVPDGSLRELLRRCLDRNARTRLRDIGEVRVALSGSIESKTAREATPRHTTSLLPWAVAALLAMSTGVALWAPWRAEPARPLMRVNGDLGPDVRLQANVSGGVEISPDGTRLAYVALRDKVPRLYLQLLDALDDEPATELPGTEGATAADFSPDSRSLVFVAGRRVSRMSVDGGVPLHLADTDLPHSNVTWGHGDMIVVSGVRGLRQIPSDKGAPVTLTEPMDDESYHSQAHVLPGANTVLFSVVGLTRGTTAIAAVSLADGERKVIESDGMTPYYLPSGHLLFLRQGTLFAVRFDLDKLETEGDAVPLVTDVRTISFGLVRPGGFSVSDNGTLVYRKGSNDPGVTETPGSSTPLHIIERTGTRSPLPAPAGAYRDLRFSPDSRQLALTVLEVPPSISILNRETGIMRSLGVAGFAPAWRPPHGQHLVFRDDDRPALHSVPTNGGQAQPLLTNLNVLTGFAFHPHGTRLAYSRRDAANRGEIFIVDLMEESGQLKAGTPQGFTPQPHDEHYPQFSRDGKWIAFVRRQSGTDEIWVRSTSGPYETQISRSGGGAVLWSPDAPELLYQAGDQVMAVRYTIKGGEFVPQRAKVRVPKLGATAWDVLHDGRIGLISRVESPNQPSTPAPFEHTVVYVQNVFDEVRRRLK
jgi:serine/threonine-protein kinase